MMTGVLERSKRETDRQTDDSQRQTLSKDTIYLIYKTFGIIFYPAQFATDIMAVPQRCCSVKVL